MPSLDLPQIADTQLDAGQRGDLRELRENHLGTADTERVDQRVDPEMPVPAWDRLPGSGPVTAKRVTVRPTGSGH